MVGGASGEDGDQSRQLLGLGGAAHDPEHGLAAVRRRRLRRVLAHRGMFPCFLGGRFARLVRSTRNARMTCTRVAEGSITAST